METWIIFHCTASLLALAEVIKLHQKPAQDSGFLEVFEFLLIVGHYSASVLSG